MASEYVINLKLKIKDLASENFKKIAKIAKDVGSDINASVVPALNKSKDSGDKFFGSMVKFGLLKKVFSELADVTKTVFKESVAQSPELAKSFEAIQEKISVILHDVGKKFIPIFQTVFSFLIDNFETVRKVIAIIADTTKVVFYGVLTTITLVMQKITGVILEAAKIGEQFGLVSATWVRSLQDNYDELGKSVEEFATKGADALENFGKVEGNQAALSDARAKARTATAAAAAKEAAAEAKKEAEAVIKQAEREAEELRRIHQHDADESIRIAKEEKLWKRKNNNEFVEQQIKSTKNGITEQILLEKLRFKLERLEAEDAGLTTEGLARIHVAKLNEIKRDYITKTGELNHEATRGTFEFYDNERALLRMQQQDDLEGVALIEKNDVMKVAIKSKTAAMIKKIDQDELNFKIGIFAKTGGAAAQLGNTVAQALTSGNKVTRKEAMAAKAVSFASALINTAVGVTNALAHGGPPPFNFIQAALVGAAGAVQAGLITQQKFAKGGLIPGGQQSITVNELGTESVLNARATQRLGRESIDRLNRGEGTGSSVSISYSPVFNGSTTMEAVGAINRHTDEELRRLAKDIQDIRVRGITP